MNICFLFGGFSASGGIGRVTSILSNELQNNGYQIYLCAFGEHKDPATYPINNECKRFAIYPENRSMAKAILFENAAGKLCKYIKSNQIDVIIACGALFYPMAAIAAKRCKIRLICWEHISPNIKSDYKFQDQGRSYGAKRSDVNVLLTRSALEIYNQRFPKSNNIQIYNPIDPSLAEKVPTYSIDSKKIISVGRLGPQKNFDRLIDIAKKVLPEHPDWVWDIYGEGDYRERLEKHVDSAGLNGRVRFLGQVSDLYDKYSEYSFMVMTSDYEGFPMTLLEGASQALPMVSFDIETGPNEIIENGVNGFLCDKANDDEMVTCVNRLIDDSTLRKNMSDSAYLTSKRFSIDSIIKKWEEVFISLKNR